MGLSIKVKIIIFVTIISLLVSIATAIYIGSSTTILPDGTIDKGGITTNTILFFMCVILLCLVSSILFALYIIKPVDELIIATQLVAEGEYEHHINPKRSDEVGRLVNSFNEMANKLNRSSIQTTKLSGIASQEKQKTGLIIDAMADSVIVTDDEHRITMFNPAAEKLFETKKEKVKWRHVAHFLKKYKMEKLFSLFPDIDKNSVLPVRKLRIESVEIAIEKPRKRIIKATVAPIRNEKNLITGTVTVIEDITKIKEIDEMKNDFVSTVSHELKTPLTNIIGYTTLLLNDRFEKLNPEQKKAMEIVGKESNVLHELINDILDLSKIESGKIRTKFEKTNLKEMIENCNALKLPVKKNIGLHIIFPENLPEIMADQAKLNQVFNNLISNAVKFTKEGGTITIKAYARKDHVHIDFIDTGIGIKSSQIPLIFNKFYQVQSHLTRTQGGTGLGLPIVKGIIGLHNGLIAVRSKLEKGTTISIALPIEHEDSNNELLPKCWEIRNCNKVKCPAYKCEDKRCWLIIGTMCKKNSSEAVFDKINCIYCDIYRAALGEKGSKGDYNKNNKEHIKKKHNSKNIIHINNI